MTSANWNQKEPCVGPKQKVWKKRLDKLKQESFVHTQDPLQDSDWGPAPHGTDQAPSCRANSQSRSDPLDLLFWKLIIKYRADVHLKLTKLMFNPDKFSLISITNL